MSAHCDISYCSEAINLFWKKGSKCPYRVNLVLIIASGMSVGRVKASHKLWGLYFMMLETQELRNTGQRISASSDGDIAVEYILFTLKIAGHT